MTARTLRWWSTASLERAAKAIAPAWHAWCFDWGVDASSAGASNASEAASARADTAPAGPWTRLTCEAPAWLRGSRSCCTDTTALLLFPSLATRASGSASTVPRIARATAVRGWTDLYARLQRCLPTAAPKGGASEAQVAPPASDMRGWSGAIQVALGAHGDAASFWIHLSGSTAEALLGTPESRRPRAPTPIDARALVTALESQHVGVRAELEGISLDLATFESLRVGDVLPLRHRLDEPLRVNVRSESQSGQATALCGGLLGARGRHRAVELFRQAG